MKKKKLDQIVLLILLKTSLIKFLAACFMKRIKVLLSSTGTQLNLIRETWFNWYCF